MSIIKSSITTLEIIFLIFFNVCEMSMIKYSFLLTLQEQIFGKAHVFGFEELKSGNKILKRFRLLYAPSVLIY